MTMKNNAAQEAQMPMKAVRPSPANVENKENAQPRAVDEAKKEKTEIVGTTAPGVGSAIDLMNIAAGGGVRPPLIKTASIDNNGAQAGYPKHRTMSNSVVMSTPLVIHYKILDIFTNIKVDRITQ